MRLLCRQGDLGAAPAPLSGDAAPSARVTGQWRGRRAEIALAT